MLKILLFAFGLIAGSAGTGAWLLSDPVEPLSPAPPAQGDTLEARLQRLKERFSVAWQEGERASQRNEEQLRRRLDAYRKGSRPIPTA